LVANSEAEFGTARLVIGGDSAGANLSVLTLLRMRDELGVTGAFSGASLAYGAYDLGGTPSARGVRASDVPDVLDPEIHELVNACYLPGLSLEERQAPEISPLFARLHDMPPALFIVGSADRLVDDSLFMAARWQLFGNDAELAVYPDCVHSFPRFPMELANRANARVDAFFERVLA
jgi:acetyl esterase/lipase